VWKWKWAVGENDETTRRSVAVVASLITSFMTIAAALPGCGGAAFTFKEYMSMR
jgi:hypothetical protein